MQRQTPGAGIAPRRTVPGTLRRDLGFWSTASLSVGGMAPTLAMSVTGVQAARLLGRAAPLAYVLAGGGMVLIGYGFVRLSAAYSHAGSVYAFIGKTLGARAGFFATWTLIGTYIVFPPVSVLAMIALAGTFGILSFGGLESAISAGEESQRPTHVIPRSIVAAVLFGAIFYVFCISGQVMGFGTGAGGVSQFAHSSAPLGDLA